MSDFIKDGEWGPGFKVGVEFQYMPVRPDTLGQEFNIRLVIAPILPSFFK
ncbi:MAG: hypothetical protein V3V96_04295 [Acidiferrobacterales bacterium]